MPVKLDAVNELLESVNEAPVSALDTGAVSVAGIAEATLDRESRRIQARGWHENKEYNVASAEPADVTKMAMVIAAGAWTYATRTLTSAAAFALYTWAYGDQLYVSGGTGVTAGWYKIQSKDTDNAIVLTTDIATADAADVTTTLIGYDGAIAIASDVIRVDTCEEDFTKDVVMRVSGSDKYLYDRDNDTFTFGASVKLSTVREFDWDDISLELLHYIIASAAEIFHENWTGDTKTVPRLERRRVRAADAAFRNDADAADTNILDSDLGQQILGVPGTTHFGH